MGFVVHVMQVAGAEMLVAATIRRLAGRIVPVVICLDAVGELGEELRRQGVEVVSLGRRPGVDLRVAWRMAAEIARWRLEVVHAHQYTPFFYAALAKVLRRGSFRLMLTEHGRHYPDRVSVRRRWVNRVLLDRQADALNACCDFSRRALSEVDGFSAARIEVVENGIDLGAYGPALDRRAALERLGLAVDRRYLATVGRFHPIKDHATLLRAFREVAEARPNVDLLLVGDGPLRAELEALTRELRVETRVRFLGIRRDVPQILSVADLFVLTSVSEAASLTLLEAMASMVPVVVTAVGGNPEIVRDGIEGILVPRGDWRAAAAAILGLLDDPAAAASMGRAGRARVEARYVLNRTIDAYYDLYSRLVGAGC